MGQGDLIRCFILLVPVIALAIQQPDILQVSLSNAGNRGGQDRINTYTPALQVEGMNHIRLAIKSTEVYMLLSETHVNTLNINTNNDYIEINIGTDVGTKSRIGVGRMAYGVPKVSTPDVLDGNNWRFFWMSWNSNSIKIGILIHVIYS